MEVTREELNEINKKLDQLVFYMHNDPTTGRKGLYDRLIDVDNRVKDLEVINKITLARKALLIGLGGVIFTLATWIYNQFFG